MYIGRFAPSPTGPLHFGSLVAAVASYLQAKTQQGQWLLRMEDLDEPRVMPGAADAILHALDDFRFEWQGNIVYQSRRVHSYAAALDTLHRQGLIYPCACSRKEIADSATQGIDGLVYPGTCWRGLAPGKSARAWRIRTPDQTMEFTDAIQGTIQQNIGLDIGDFVLKRADGLFAYQLAVVVDDAEQGVTDIVRGADLLDSTPRQLYLQQCLGYQRPSYAHVPVATNAQGEKLSKQTLATAIHAENAAAQIWRALDFLGQHPPAELAYDSVTSIWQWAFTHWRLETIPKHRSELSNT